MKLSQVMVAVIVIVMLSGSGFSQGGVGFGVNGEVALPMGTFGDVAGTGFGGTALVAFPASENLILLGRAGFITWGGKEIDVLGVSVSSKYSAIPLMGGSKKYFGEGSTRFFATGEVGVHMFKVTSESAFQNPLTGQVEKQSASATETKISVAPGVGVEFGGSTKITVAARYNYVADKLSYLGLRLGILFGGGE